MGSWGSGVYDSDSALDCLGGLKDELVRRIVFDLADESLTDWPPGAYDFAPAAVEILALWCEHSGYGPPVTKKTIRYWKTLYLARFEADGSWDKVQLPDGLDARAERRKVIAATFDRLESAAYDER